MDLICGPSDGSKNDLPTQAERPLQQYCLFRDHGFLDDNFLVPSSKMYVQWCKRHCQVVDRDCGHGPGNVAFVVVMVFMLITGCL